MADEREGVPEARPPRRLYCVFQVATLALTAGFSWVARGFDTVFRELEMKALPAPTEAFLALAAFLRTPVGAASLVLLAAVLVSVALKGGFDRILSPLIVANALFGLILVPFATLSLRMPVLQIQRALDEK